jgi:two-component sensor histidine kinase
VLRATQATIKAYQKKRAIKIGESIAGRALEENRPIIVRDVQTDSEYIGHDLAVEQGLRSMICVPLSIMDKPVGVLSCYTEDVRDFASDEIKALETLAQQAALAIENAKLQVRDTLMQEMHHRVKNNLQQVASLLRLQLRAANYKTLEEALNDVLTRILAIAAVHDLLSREDLDRVGIKTIAESLVHTQQSSLILPNKEVEFSIRGDDFKLEMNQATQIAMVMNELISNAVEHGFAVANKGEIHISIEEKDNDICLWVSNSGDKLPENFDPLKTTSLGLQIVESLLVDTTLITDESREEGKKVRAFYQAFTFKILQGKQLSEFDNNAMLIANREVITGTYDLAVIASLPSCYERGVVRQTVDQRVNFSTGGFIGSVGNKVTTTIEVLRSVFSHTYNVNFITGITSDDQVVFFAYKSDLEVGKMYDIYGTVKGYRDNSTQLNRVKVIA